MRLYKMFTCNPLYLQFGHRNVFKLKSVQYESCSEFQNLQLRIHCTYGSDTETSLRQKSFEYTKLLKISKPKVLL
jgi:hypothetical protein